MKHLCDIAEQSAALLAHLLQAHIKSAAPTVFDLMMAECAGSPRGCGRDERADESVTRRKGVCDVLLVLSLLHKFTY